MHGLKVSGNKTALAKRLQSAVKMNLRKTKLKNIQCAQKKKLNHYEDERSEAVYEFPETSAEESVGILEMPIEIIEYIFDYLDIEELSAVSKTCKWMQQVARRSYHQNYSGLYPYFDDLRGREIKNGIVDILRLGYKPNYIEVDSFIPLFDKILISSHTITRERTLYKLNDLQSQFLQLKELSIIEIDMTNVNIGKMKEVLSKLEYLDIFRCKITDEFLENLLNLAPNLKRLCLYWSPTENRWLERNYPNLEHCEIVSETFVPITVFLAHNPNIRKFGTNLIILWKNIHLIKTGEINLDNLAVTVTHNDCLHALNLRLFWQLLDEHRRSGIFKRLHLVYDGFDQFNQELVDGIVLSTAVERFYVGKHFRVEGVALSELKFLANVDDFTFPDSRFIMDIETVATKLQSLKRVHFKRSNFNHVKLFIGRNLKLQEIRVDWFMNEVGMREELKVLNLVELNKERAKLRHAEKMTLFVKEPVYLATKRAKRETELEFITLKRTEALNDKHFDFGYKALY